MSIRSILSSPAFLAAWSLAGIPAAAVMCHDVAIAATTGAALPAAGSLLAGLAQGSSLLALRLLAAATSGAATGAGSPQPGVGAAAPVRKP